MEERLRLNRTQERQKMRRNIYEHNLILKGTTKHLHKPVNEYLQPTKPAPTGVQRFKMLQDSHT